MARRKEPEIRSEALRRVREEQARKKGPYTWRDVLLVAVVVGFFIWMEEKDSKVAPGAPLAATPAQAGTSPPAKSAEAIAHDAIYSRNRSAYAASAPQLFQGYSENEVRQDALIEGREVMVSGTVQEVRKDALGNVVIDLETGNRFMPARLAVLPAYEQVAANLLRGDQAMLICQKMARVIGSPSGSGCRF
jgi:hypothetical protein